MKTMTSSIIKNKTIKNKSIKNKSIKNKTIKKSNKPSLETSLDTETELRIKNLKSRVTRKDVRKHEVERVSNIISLIPKFTKLYNKFTSKELMALKYYKGDGSLWQTQLLTNESKIREISFPFYKREEMSFRNDIYSEGNEIYPMLNSFDIKDIPKYIENNYRARIILLNTLDTIYNKILCPKLTGEEILFRGIIAPPSLKKCKSGDTFTFKNFISTTFDRSVAELYSHHDTLVVLTNMKDIPFLYMPNMKSRFSSNIDYTKQLGDSRIVNDLSECVLPRNLEFKIDKIEQGIISPENSFRLIKNKGNKNRINHFSKLEKLLKKKGILEDLENTKDTKDTKDKTTSKNQAIEDSIFPKVTIYYCSFIKWHPRIPISYHNIIENSKFVLDKNALRTWSNIYDDEY